MAACRRCGGVVAPDGYCWDCGHRQPGWRDHLELSLPGGAAGVTDRGRRHSRNEDAMALVAAGDWVIGVVCDGVSMSPRPEQASRIAAETGAAALADRLAAGVVPETAARDAALRAGAAVAALAASVHEAPACTYVAGMAGPDGIWVCWVGDSRAYWLPAGDPAEAAPAIPLTEDDLADRNVLSAWLGADAGPVDPHLRGYRPASAGVLVLCTDGLWRYLPDADTLCRALPATVRAGGDGLLDGARGLLRQALAAGGADNITVLLIPTPGRLA